MHSCQKSTLVDITMTAANLDDLLASRIGQHCSCLHMSTLLIDKGLQGCTQHGLHFLKRENVLPINYSGTGRIFVTLVLVVEKTYDFSQSQCSQSFSFQSNKMKRDCHESQNKISFSCSHHIPGIFDRPDQITGSGVFLCINSLKLSSSSWLAKKTSKIFLIVKLFIVKTQPIFIFFIPIGTGTFTSLEAVRSVF